MEMFQHPCVRLSAGFKGNSKTRGQNIHTEKRNNGSLLCILAFKVTSKNVWKCYTFLSYMQELRAWITCANKFKGWKRKKKKWQKGEEHFPKTLQIILELSSANYPL